MREPPPLHDYAQSRAVLVGGWDYTNLPDVGAATRNSLTRMERLLTGLLCGWPQATRDETSRVQIVRNPERRGDLPHDLVTWFQDVTDIALFYFVGHGQLYEDELCLALKQSPGAGPGRKTLGLRFSDVREALDESNARTKIVILDCCFSGRATSGGNTLGSVDIGYLATCAGAVTLAASDAYKAAWFESSSEATDPQTYFTRFFVDTIEQGLPGYDQGLPLNAVYTATAAKLAQARKPRPTRSERHDAGQFVIARNPIGSRGPEAFPHEKEPSQPVRKAASENHRSDLTATVFPPIVDPTKGLRYIFACAFPLAGLVSCAMWLFNHDLNRMQEIAAIALTFAFPVFGAAFGAFSFYLTSHATSREKLRIDGIGISVEIENSPQRLKRFPRLPKMLYLLIPWPEIVGICVIGEEIDFATLLGSGLFKIPLLPRSLAIRLRNGSPVTGEPMWPEGLEVSGPEVAALARKPVPSSFSQGAENTLILTEMRFVQGGSPAAIERAVRKAGYSNLMQHPEEFLKGQLTV